VILKGHGFGLSKEIAEDDLHQRLTDEGYAVLTWDARGFGRSGGEANIDQPDIEGRDTSALIDFVAEQPGILLDAPGDPRLGMAGESYGGGIQLATAAFDPRIDALAPQITWHSLASRSTPAR
jgi:ABC-2 type transport system ATP-binding protein